MDDIIKNEYFITISFAWFTAQFLKIIFTSIKEKKLNLIKFFHAGGMPSSHTAPAVAFTTLVAIKDGMDNSLFVLSFLITLVIMYDAAGVRRKAEEHAKSINKMIDELSEKNIIDKVKYKRLSEFIGHTPLEVIGGAAVGIISAIFLYYNYFR